MARLFNLSSSSSSVDGESSLQEHPGEREGDADLLYLHGEEQQEPLGPERRRRQTAGLNFPTAQQQ